MKNSFDKFIVGALVLTATSCIGNYIDINTNPYQPGADEMQADDYILGSAMNNLAGCVVSSDVNTAQFTDCLTGGPLGGYWADSNTGWGNTIANFNATDNWTNVFLKTDKIIPQLYTNLTAVQNICDQTGDPVPYAIALIIKVACMSRVTDAYGPIPYSKIGQDGSITTPYDTQAEVYNKFFEELDEAVETLNDNPGAALNATADYVYYGDVSKWIKFANSLRLRLAMRIVYADQTLAKEQAEKAVNAGVIESNSDNAQWNYFGSITNPLYTATRYNSASDHNCLTGGDTHTAADIICYMNGYNDPRRPMYFTESEWDGYTYVGIGRSIEITTLGGDGHKYSGVNITQTDPIVWLNAAEMAFCRAEAAGVFNFSVGGSAQDFYEQGIELSFEQWGAGSAASYIADNTSTPALYVDPAGQNSYSSIISTVTIAWDEGASTAEKQEKIITQKWIANWMIGNEAWADFRRTGYPKMIPARNNQSGGTVDDVLGARRLPYPTDEYVSNQENVEEAVARYLGGPDNWGTRIWWDCNPDVN
ncbi:MAG: SusD/RagB family nutrient-binding outer membrane lipoprotein [Bacteroidales bacterium]|nr:SusD/RagB family nutrient-binding outer membrane lipoprotein [Bacteroidales bacterium]